MKERGMTLLLIQASLHHYPRCACCVCGQGRSAIFFSKTRGWRWWQSQNVHGKAVQSTASGASFDQSQFGFLVRPSAKHPFVVRYEGCKVDITVDQTSHARFGPSFRRRSPAGAAATR
ncbi:hypothetical protein IWX49DRAFT_244936 [Phyllosticta citricarpa]